MKTSVLGVLTLLFAFWAAPLANASDEPDPDSGQSQEIIGKYLQATHESADTGNGASMEVDINAFVPKLKENGRLHALRVISRVGRISYRVLGFQGSNTIKNQVIARYLQAEQQGQADASLAITPVNYKFKLRGGRRIESGKEVFVFQLAPRESRVGLFKGEIWLDASNYLPVYERGRLVKNPSLFFKRVDFERAFSVQSGRVIPEHMNSVISTRIVGRVEVDVNYSNYAQTAEGDGGPGGELLNTTLSSN